MAKRKEFQNWGRFGSYSHSVALVSNWRTVTHHRQLKWQLLAITDEHNLIGTPIDCAGQPIGPARTFTTAEVFEVWGREEAANWSLDECFDVELFVMRHTLPRKETKQPATWAPGDTSPPREHTPRWSQLRTYH